MAAAQAFKARGMQVQQALVDDTVGNQPTGQVRREWLVVQAPAYGGEIHLRGIGV